MKIPEELSTETQKKICAAHVRHFTRMVEAADAGAPGIRRNEAVIYLATWQAGAAALEAGEPVPADCADEIRDAIDSGDYDAMLTEEELGRWNAFLEKDPPSSRDGGQ